MQDIRHQSYPLHKIMIIIISRGLHICSTKMLSNRVLSTNNATSVSYNVMQSKYQFCSIHGIIFSMHINIPSPLSTSHIDPTQIDVTKRAEEAHPSCIVRQLASVCQYISEFAFVHVQCVEYTVGISKLLLTHLFMNICP